VRNGTVAAKMSNQIPEITKTMRVAEMIAMGKNYQKIMLQCLTVMP